MCCTRLAENTERKKSPFWHHRTTLSGCVFAAEAHIDNRKKPVKHRYLPHMSSYYGELWPPNGWDLLASLGHPCKFQRLLRLGSVTTRHSSSGRQPNFAALNRGHHLYSAGRPLRWRLAHILVQFITKLQFIQVECKIIIVTLQMYVRHSVNYILAVSSTKGHLADPLGSLYRPKNL